MSCDKCDSCKRYREDADRSLNLMAITLEQQKERIAFLEKEVKEFAEDRLNWKMLANERAGEISTAYKTLKKIVIRYREALERIADPRLRHREPDAYTELGCVMNIADQALKERP